MRLTCRLREFRGEARSLRDIAVESGVSAGVLSLVEQGRYLVKDDQVEPLERAYGQPVEEWYSKVALRAIQEDTL